MKYVNLLIFITLLSIYLFFSSSIKFSTNFLDIFLSQKNLNLFNIAKKFDISNEILISKKGFDKKSLDDLYEISEKLKQLPEISNSLISLKISKEMKEYIKRNYFLLADFDNSKLMEKDVLKKLENIHSQIYDSVLYEPINSYDPLGLFSTNYENNERYFKLKNYGYVLKTTTNIDTSNAEESRKIYNKVNLVLDEYTDVIVFSPFFYLVENSSYIRTDAQKIMLISTILLLVLYFFILKNIKLFFNTVFAIGSSIICAILLTSIIFEQISILALVFGISITTISIDYMFHYYFHNEFGKRKFIVQKSVIYGFLTSFGVFVIFSFINIELFSQLAIFSAISLVVAFILFSWLFVYLEIPILNIDESNKNKSGLKPIYIIGISIIMLTFVYKNLAFDNKLKNLDYQNKSLIELSKKFKDGFSTDEYEPVIISAKDEESLLQKYEEYSLKYPNILGVGNYILSSKKCNQKLEELKEYNFERIKIYIDRAAQEMGFDDTFKNAYPSINNLECNMNFVTGMKFKIIKDKKIYFTMALVDKEYNIKNEKDLQVVNLGKRLDSDTKIMKNTLLKYMMFSIIFISVILFIIAKSEILYPLSYMIFPISMVLFVITLLGQINIMHIFALVILLAVGIDYGIYMYKTTCQTKTKLAIKYALLSTFSGFGVLIFSSTVALHSIGLVISVGIASIFFLLYSSL